MTFNVEKARQAGKTDKEISSYLSRHPEYTKTFNVDKALKSGKTQEEISAYLSKHPEYVRKEPQSKEPPDSAATSFARDVAQPFIGAVNSTAPAIIGDISSMIAMGESISDFDELNERLPRLKRLFPDMGVPDKIDKKSYMDAVVAAQEVAPTWSNFVKGVDRGSKYLADKTGIPWLNLPLEAKTDFQKNLRTLGMGAKFSIGTIPQKIHTGIKAAMYSQILKDSGVPEIVSDIYGLTASQYKLPIEASTKASRKAAQVALNKRFPDEPPPPPPPDEPPGAGGVGQMKDNPPSGGIATASDGSTPSGGSPNPPSMDSKAIEYPWGEMKSENELLDKLVPMLEKNREAELAKIGPAKEYPISRSKILGSKPTHNEVALSNEIGGVVSKERADNSTKLASETKDYINTQSTLERNAIKELYDDVNYYSQGVKVPSEKLVKDLNDLTGNIKALEPSSVQKQIRTIANKYAKKGTKTKGTKGKKATYNDIELSSLIDQIKNNNEKINHDFIQGRPSNSFIKINEILGEAIESGVSLSSNAEKAIESYNEAREMYRN